MRVALSEAEGPLAELVERAEGGDQVVQTRHGRSVGLKMTRLVEGVGMEVVPVTSATDLARIMHQGWRP